MQLYSAKVRLKGDLYNEVSKTALSAAEILLLQHIHGADSVVGITPTGDDPDRMISAERDRLSITYPKYVDKVFPAHATLPRTFGNFIAEDPAPSKGPQPEVDISTLNMAKSKKSAVAAAMA